MVLAYPLAVPDSMTVQRPFLPWEPVAAHVAAEAQDTLSSSLYLAPRLGLGTTDQLVPFHDSIRVL